MMASSYYDHRDAKTHCGRCDSASWCVLGYCTECEQACCDCCASLEGKSDLLCSQCALVTALEAEGLEVEPVEAEPGMAAYKVVPPAQGHLFPELDTRKSMRVEVSGISEEVA